MTSTLVIILLAAAPAQALRSPSDTQKYEIVDTVNRANYAVDEGKNADYGEAARLKRALEEEMGLLDGSGKLRRLPTEEDLKKISGGWFGKDRRAEYNIAATRVAAYQEQSYLLRDEAIQKTKRYYGIDFKTESGTIVSGKPSQIGRSITLNPRFSQAPINTGLEDDVLPALVAWESGRVLIRPTAFQSKKYSEFDPGYLAFVIHHEGTHVALALTPNVDLRSEPAVERAMRVHDLKDEQVYQLSRARWEDEFLQAAAFDYLKTQWQFLIDQGYDPYEAPTAFSSLNISSAKEAEIRSHVARDLQRFAQARDRQREDPSFDPIEAMRTEAESEFVRNMSPTELQALMSAHAKAIELEKNKKARTFNSRLVGIDYEAARCGFDTLADDPAKARFGFAQVDNHSYWFHFQGPTTLEEARIYFLLANACTWTRDNLCNDALGELNANWVDVRKRERLDLTPAAAISSEQRGCMARLLDLQPPLREADVLETVRNYWAEIANRRDAQEEAELRRRRQSEPHPAPVPSRSVASGDSDCFWSSDLGMWICRVRPK
ncbi:MAG: hypothetical protein HY925_15585 [Elusimicrobia bacterium]|nr:hypothetical protein [Elusimicrobiota bacterium]